VAHASVGASFWGDGMYPPTDAVYHPLYTKCCELDLALSDEVRNAWLYDNADAFFFGGGRSQMALTFGSRFDFRDSDFGETSAADASSKGAIDG
jgi:hypothetical protein